MCKELEEMIQELSKENILNFLNFSKQKYLKLDDKKIGPFIDNFNEGILGLIFITVSYFKEEIDKQMNCFFLENDSVWLLICFYLINVKKEDFISRIENVLRMIEDEWIDKEGIFLKKEAINDVISIADDKYNLINLLKNSKSTYFFFNIPYINKYAETHTVVINANDKEIFLHELYGLEKNYFPLEYSFAYLLGLSLYNYACQKNIKLIKKFKEEFNVADEYLSERFSEAFGASLLRYTVYEDDNLDQILIEKYNKYFEEIIPKLRKKREISKESLCPCGSNKKYKDCCKLKELKWIKENGEIKREVKMASEVKTSFKKYIEDYEELIGRKAYGYEKVFNLLPTSEIMNPYEYMFTLLIDKDVDLARQYATLKTEMFLTEMNINQYPDLDLKEWQDAIDEFNKKNSIKIKDNKSIFELVKEANTILKDLPLYISKALTILNVFVNKITDLQFLYSEFKVKTQEDFGIVCARKLFKDGEILKKGIEDKSVEEVSNITRILFEDLIQTEVFLKKYDLFQEKILSLSLLETEEAYYKINQDGTTSKNIIINKKNNEQYNIKINMREMSSKSDNYQDFYDDVFDGLSSFIHLNITKIPRYFKLQNPLTEINESRLTGLLGFFLINQSIFEIKDNLKLDKLLIRDLEYVYYQNSMFIKECLTVIDPIEKDNEILRKINNIITECIKKLNPNNTKKLI